MEMREREREMIKTRRTNSKQQKNSSCWIFSRSTQSTDVLMFHSTLRLEEEENASPDTSTDCNTDYVRGTRTRGNLGFFSVQISKDQ